ncbi:MAG: hypothetical protein IJT95_03330 [Abditibacteriota bacterium]|nr:hypothetical protein [Abditibacteriota bacterium]
MKPDKLVLVLYLIVFILFLTLIKLNPVILGLAGLLPAFMAVCLSFLRQGWIRRVLKLYGAGVFILQLIFVGNFFARWFPADNALVMLLLAPMVLAALILFIADLAKR